MINLIFFLQSVLFFLSRICSSVIRNYLNKYFLLLIEILNTIILNQSYIMYFHHFIIF
jgi:hypothetical protein